MFLVLRTVHVRGFD